VTMAEYWEILLKEMARTEGRISDEFLLSIESTVKKTDWKAFEQALSTGQLDAAIDHIDWLQFDPERLVELGVSDAAHAASDMITLVSKVNYRYDPKMAPALDWIKQYSADEVKYINPASKQAIRDAVQRAYASSVAPTANTKLIKSLVGLTPSQAKSVENYQAALIKKGKSPEAAQKATDKYAAKRLKQRAETIAVNEASEASCHGHFFSTKDAVQRGIIDPAAWEGSRMVTPDERSCKICRPLNGETRQLPDGVYSSTGSQLSKIHTRCRCIELLREIEMKKKEMKESGKTRTDVIFEAKSLKRKDGIIYCPTVPLVEGVFSGLGFPVLRLYEEFSKDAKWLNGLTVLTNHEELNPNARRVGQLSDTQARPEKKDVVATTQFFESDLTPKEVDAITSKQPLHGSLSLSYNLEQSSGDYNGKHYEAIERGPYVFFEYSMVREGIVTPEDGAGFNMECKGCNSKSHSHSRSSAPGGADMEIDEVKEMITEAWKR
jgi:hypothetical protein